MGDEERRKLEEEADRMQKEGLPPDVQRRWVPNCADRVPMSAEKKPIYLN